MKYNIIFVCIILIVLSISAVNAIDENNTLHSDTQNNEYNCIISEDNTQNNNLLLYDANIQSGKSMNELKNIIDSSPIDKVKLTSDFLYNYSKDNDLEEGIPITKSMTIDGQGHKIDANHKMKIFQIRDNANVVFKNIVLLNGGGIYGGAICNHAKTPVCVENSTFIYNHCVIDGGAIYSEGDVIIKNCLFDNNMAKGSSKQCYGGAIRSKNIVSIDNSTFKNNYAEDYGGAIYADNIYINTNNKDKTFNSIFMNNDVGDNDGGAIYSTDKIIINNAKFIKNNAYEDGGAIYCKDADLNNCLFEDNYVSGAKYSSCDGGAIYCKNDLNIENSIFNHNTGECGGAIYTEKNAHIINTNFTKNIAKTDGGAIYSKDYVNIKKCLFDNNEAKGSSKQCYGGAIRSKNIVSIDNSTFKNNYAEDYGGAIYANTITWINTRSYFIGNCANDNQGGAIYTNKFNNDVSNAFFINNNVKSNDDGGAIYINEENTVTFSHCLFEGNHCGDEGGAIYLDSRKSHLTLKNNNFINNGAGDEGQCVFNKGYYNEITDNFWNDMNPSTENDQLVEWKQWGENIKHADKNPSPQKILKKKNI